MKNHIVFPILFLTIFALLFCATMVAVSLRDQRNDANSGMILADGNKFYEKTYPFQSGGKLILDSDIGDITVNGTDKNEVSIVVTAKGSTEKLERFTVSSSQDGNTVRIDGKMKHHYFHMFGNNTPDVRFDVQVPKSCNLRLETSGGDITIDGVKGTIDGETSGGDLDLRHLDGTVRMNTSGGNVLLKTGSGEFTLETSGGNMSGEDVTGPVHLETSGGNIELRNCDGKIYASTSGGNIHAVLKDNKGVDLSTSGGNLTVRLPKSIAADVNAEASGGDVSCDFPVTGKLREGALHGKINGGGNIIRLETSGGDIVINTVE